MAFAHVNAMGVRYNLRSFAPLSIIPETIEREILVPAAILLVAFRSHFGRHPKDVITPH
jgi:hypothetical protein